MIESVPKSISTFEKSMESDLGILMSLECWLLKLTYQIKLHIAWVSIDFFFVCQNIIPVCTFWICKEAYLQNELITFVTII